MNLLRRSTPSATAPATPPAAGPVSRCDACHYVGDPVEHHVIGPDSMLTICVEPRACKQRSLAAGDWCTYDPVAIR